MNKLLQRPRARGVTMIEMIVVIVITGIIGGVVALFIRLPAQSYTDSVARAAATDMADTTLRRLSRDLRLALPNSVRVTPTATGSHIEFLQTTAGLRYLAEDDVAGTAAPGNYLNWNDATDVTFDVVGGVPAGRHAPAVGNYVVVYNLGQDQEPGNAYNCGVATPCNRALITGLSATTITMAANPFAAQAAGGVALMSPGKRLHVVTSAVTYACDTARRKLTRHWDYTIMPDQPTTFTDGKSALVAENITGCDFQYANLSNQRSGLIGLSLEMAIAGQPHSSVKLEHQVHVDNTP